MGGKINYNELKLSFYDSADLVNKADWNRVTGEKNIYLTLEYLSGLENAMTGEIEFRYIVFYDKFLTPFAVAYFQLIHLAEKGLKYREIFCRIADRIKNKLIESIDVKVLLCGNIFACGENGFAFTSDIEAKEAYHLLAVNMDRIAQEKEEKRQVSFGIVKEFWPSSTEQSKILIDSSFKDFMIDVNMVLKIQPTWKNMEDYLGAMNTKFRTKANGVFKKSSALKMVNFEAKDILKHIIKIVELYQSVLANAEYKFSELSGKAFVNFKQKLNNQFIFRAYFYGEKMVGFSSAFHFGNVLDANFVGLDYGFNKDLAIYQRMLYDFVALSIELGATELRLGRTAELVKSSMGALPINMVLYAKHRNSISNKLLSPFISSISPSKFELRSPFKKTDQL